MLLLAREPRLHPVRIADLKPTQITLGLREVAAKRAQWRAESPEQKPDFLGKHLIPVVLGPGHKPYLIDHHHLARALLDEGVEEVAVTVVADLAKLEREAFFVFLDNRCWAHLYDAEGERRGFDDLPKRVADMADDPYRSLAGALRRAGGFAKDTAPFSEFLWADFMRRRIKPKFLARHFDQSLEIALELAKSPEADFLPGWCGPAPMG